MMTRSTTTAAMLDAITEEAIAWFVRTHSDQRTLGDEDRFAQWLKQDPLHAQAYARIEKVWRVADTKITPRILAGEEGRSSAPHFARRTWKAIAGVAAVLAVVAIGTGLLIEQRNRIRTGTFATEAGGQREIKLADGSIIILNTRSEVSVNLGQRQRWIRLVRGEARFQVAKDTARPFIVDAGAAQVRAVGTAFDVKVSDARVAVTLVEGVVEVTPTSAVNSLPEPALLSAGQQLSFEVGTGERRVATVNLDRASAWLHQQLIFDAAPLPAAIEEANRYLQVPIAIGDPSLAEIRVSGVVRAGSLTSIVGAVEASFPVEAITQPDGRITLMRRNDVSDP